MWPKRGMRREEDVEGARSDWLIKLTNKVSKIETNGEFFLFFVLGHFACFAKIRSLDLDGCI